MRRPTFSVVTVNLNSGGLLRFTVTSVLGQACDDFEYIIKDGGSSDGSLPDSLESDSVRLVASPDTGIYDAMNQAISKCCGQYTLFLNAGDELADGNVLGEVLKVAADSGFPEVVYTDYFNMKYGGTIRYPETLTRRWLFRKSLCHQATFVRRDCFERFGLFDTSFRFLADNEFLLRMLFVGRGRSVHCRIVGCKYRDDGVSADPRHGARVRCELKRIRRNYFSQRERLVWGGIHALTLPRVRIWALRRFNVSGYGRFYMELANRIQGT